MGLEIERQKEFIVDAVLNLHQKVKALEFLIEKYAEKESCEVSNITFGVFGDLMDLIHSLLWDNIVVNCYWLYEKNSERGLNWYIAQSASAVESVDRMEAQKKQIEALNDEMTRIKKFRDKWIVHRDKVAFNKYTEFWSKEKRVTLTDLRTLSNTAHEIVQENFPVSDLTNSGVHIPFVLTEWLMKKEGILNDLKYFAQ